jgi:hypothetical protein
MVPERPGVGEGSGFDERKTAGWLGRITLAEPSTPSPEAPMSASPPRPALPELDRIDLGPDLPVTVFHSTERWHPERIGALAVYCSDGRWGEAFDEFCHRSLLIPRYDRWAVPGGPAWLAVPAGLGFDHAARGQLDFLVTAHGLDRIVLITHYGCAAYLHRLSKQPDDCLPIQLAEVATAARVLRGWYPQMRVEGYLAMRRDDHLTFHELVRVGPVVL